MNRKIYIDLSIRFNQSIRFTHIRRVFHSSENIETFCDNFIFLRQFLQVFPPSLSCFALSSCAFRPKRIPGSQGIRVPLSRSIYLLRDQHYNFLNEKKTSFNTVDPLKTLILDFSWSRRT